MSGAGLPVLQDLDGRLLLTSAAVGPLLATAVAHGDGRLLHWRLDQVDVDPQRSTTATYRARVDWPAGRREELFGVTVRAGGPSEEDDRAVIMAAGGREVAVWIYPRDPALPGLVRAAFPAGVAALLSEHRVLATPVSADRVRLEVLGYRPRRSAVLRAVVATSAEPAVFFLKVLPPSQLATTVVRHELLLGAGLPVPQIVAAEADSLLVLRSLPGRRLANAVLDAELPCAAAALIDVLDAMPADVGELTRQQPWADAVAGYAAQVGATLPALALRLQTLVTQIRAGLAGARAGTGAAPDATHGDFHEGQLLVQHGRVSGLLDVDAIGPGRRADDLACLLAHLSTSAQRTERQAARVQRVISAWLPVFDTRVDPTELRLRAAAVAVSLATGPYRAQQRDWPRETYATVETAERLVRSIG